MKTLLALLLTGLSYPAMAVDLLKAPPPCPAPADLPASASADYDPAREAAAGIAPADIEGAGQGVNLDVPLYIYPEGSASQNSSAQATAPGQTNSRSRLPESGIPIGGVAIRNGKAVSTNILGRETLPGAPPINPATGMPLTPEELAKAQQEAAAHPCGTR